ncbi:MAG TPA: NRDE family protein, partial [Thermoanaerobaculia bacterium]|nr:NRDE family protein [Thermoanaerobaculia bacterium]
PGDDWPKVQLAREAMESALAQPEQLLDFLTTRRGGAIEQEVFVVAPEHGYGTRSSTVITVDRAGAVTFIERAAPGGAEARWRLPSPS